MAVDVVAVDVVRDVTVVCVVVDIVVEVVVVGHVRHLAGQALATVICRMGSITAPLEQSLNLYDAHSAGSSTLSHRGPGVHAPQIMRHRFLCTSVGHVLLSAIVAQSPWSATCRPFSVHLSAVPVVVVVMVVVGFVLDRT